MEEKRISFSVSKESGEVFFSLILTLESGASECFSICAKEGESKDQAFTALLYELMRLDALYSIPVSTQLEILCGMLNEENLNIIE